MTKDPAEFDPRKYMKEAMLAAREICVARYEAFGCAGKASTIKPLSLEVMAKRYAA
jgi:fructose-bisphosphate aldolase class II